MVEFKETANGVDVHMRSISRCKKCVDGWYLSDCEERCDKSFMCDDAIRGNILAKYNELSKITNERGE